SADLLGRQQQFGYCCAVEARRDRNASTQRWAELSSSLSPCLHKTRVGKPLALSEGAAADIGRRSRTMYKATKVYDVHGHVTPTPHRNAFLVNLLTSNAAARSPLSQGGRAVSGNFGTQMNVGDDAYKVAAESHAKYMDERNIDVQVI